MEAKIEHVLVDPEVSFVYTRRKRPLLGLEDALDPNSSVPSDYFLLMNGGQHLQKLPVRTWTDILRIQEKKHQNSEYHSLPTGLREAKAFLADEYLHEIQTHQDQSYLFLLSREVLLLVKKLITCNVYGVPHSAFNFSWRKEIALEFCWIFSIHFSPRRFCMSNLGIM